MCSEELKPCPFCGFGNISPESWFTSDWIPAPRCDDCGASADSIEAWNRRASPWQPIESAPRDCQSVLVSDGVNVDQAEYDENNWVATGGKKKSGNDLGYTPTQWMPLPEPPR